MNSGIREREKERESGRGLREAKDRAIALVESAEGEMVGYCDPTVYPEKSYPIGHIPKYADLIPIHNFDFHTDTEEEDGVKHTTLYVGFKPIGQSREWHQGLKRCGEYRVFDKDVPRRTGREQEAVTEGMGTIVSRDQFSHFKIFVKDLAEDEKKRRSSEPSPKN